MNENQKKEEDNRNNPPKEINTNDIIYRKSYRVPNANNKKGFDKINIYNFIGITKLMTFAELSEVLFVNKKFYNIISHRYIKKIPMIKTSLSILKKTIFFKFSEDFRFYLSKNSYQVKKVIKKIVETLVTENLPKLGIKKYFFGKIYCITHITEILLNNCQIGKKSMKYLSFYLDNPNCLIKDINISGNKINGEILKPIESNKELELNSLIADKCTIDYKTIHTLSHLKIKKVSLIGNNIDNELISKFNNNYLNILNISNNLISNDGILNICKNIPNLTKLNIANNNICDLSIIYICLYLKKQNSKLQSLNLKNNQITISGMFTLISTLNYINTNNKDICPLKRLNLSGNLLYNVHFPKRLGTNFLNVKLEKLNLSNHSFNIDDLKILFNFINNIKNIKILDLSKTTFDKESLNLIFNRVSENTSLKKLKLQNCFLGNTEVNNALENYYSKNNIKKEIIKENNNKNIDNENKNEIKKDEQNNSNNNNENDLNIYNDYLGVESLDLGYNFINFKRLNNIILSNHLKELNIEGNDLHLWGNDLILFFDFIIPNKFLEKLNVSRNNLTDMGNKLLEKIYNYNSDNNSNCFLKYLSLEDNQIKDINLELTNLLSNNKNLEVLNLNQNLIGDEIGNNYFFHSLFKNKISNIKEINIKDNKISLEFIDKILKYSKENVLENNNFILNVTSKEIRESYLNKENKKVYWDLINLNCIKCF